MTETTCMGTTTDRDKRKKALEDAGYTIIKEYYDSSKPAFPWCMEYEKKEEEPPAETSVRNHGTGTGWSSEGITGKKSQFGANEKVYAEWIVDGAEKDAYLRILWYRKENGKWVIQTSNTYQNTAGYKACYQWAWTKDWEQGNWKVDYSYNGKVMASDEFILGTVEEKPPPVIPEETTEFWTAKGYTTAQAEKLAAWCIINKMTPLPETIAKIIKIEEPPEEEEPTVKEKIYLAWTHWSEPKWRTSGLSDIWIKEQEKRIWEVGFDPEILQRYKDGTFGTPPADWKAVYIPPEIEEPPTEKIGDDVFWKLSQEERFALVKASAARSGITPYFPPDTREDLDKILKFITDDLGILERSAALSYLTASGMSRIEPIIAVGLSGLLFLGIPYLATIGGWGVTRVATHLPDVSGVISGGKWIIPISKIVSTTTVAASKGTASSLSFWIKIMVIWNVATDWVWIQNMLRELGTWITGDVSKRLNTLRFTINEQIKELNNKISFAEEVQDWAEIKTRLDVLIPLFDEYKKLLEEAGVKEKLPDIWAEFILMESHLNEFLTKATQMTEPPTFEKEFTLENVEVVDGDSIKFPGHPEVNNEIRFLGIDTHELGTTAGKEEANYLKSLIEGKTVTIMTHEYKDVERTIGLYGRLLAGVFLEGKDIVLEMLKKFGDDILTATKYQKKYRWIDWDEYKAAAKGLIEKAGKIKIYTKPAYASIWIDDKDTKKLAIETFELPPGNYKITIKKTGYEDMTETITLEADDYIEKRYELIETSLVPPDEKPPDEIEFSISIDSEPTRAKLYIDNVYTHHLTPSNTKELKDVMRLLTPGPHIIKITKAGMQAEKEITITSGANPDIFLTLEIAELPPEVPKTEKEIMAEIENLEKQIEELKKMLE